MNAPFLHLLELESVSGLQYLYPPDNLIPGQLLINKIRPQGGGNIEQTGQSDACDGKHKVSMILKICSDLYYSSFSDIESAIQQ